MKKFYLLILSLTLTCAAFAQPKAKYVFYFIGDGMGVNQVNGAETYLAALENRIGIKSLCFTQFPYAAFVTTYSATNGVTDSAAGGTALATGHKTKNGAISCSTRWRRRRHLYLGDSRPRHTGRLLCPRRASKNVLWNRQATNNI